MKTKVKKVKRYITRKENIKKLFFEFIAAFMGVLIAMVLSNWQQHRKENDFIKKSITNIYRDNISNIDNLRIQINDLNNHLDTFKHYKNDETLTLLDIIHKNKYIILRPVQSNGWEILERSNLIYKLEYNVASQLSNLQDQAEIIFDRRKGVTDMLYNSTYSTSSDDKKTMRMNLIGLNSATNIFLERAMQVDSILEVTYKRYLEIEVDTIINNL